MRRAGAGGAAAPPQLHRHRARASRPARRRRPSRRSGSRGPSSRWTGHGRHQGDHRPKPPTPGGHIPFTPRAKKVLELSLREAMRLRDPGSTPLTSCSGSCAREGASARRSWRNAGLDFDEAAPRTSPPSPPRPRHELPGPRLRDGPRAHRPTPPGWAADGPGRRSRPTPTRCWPSFADVHRRGVAAIDRAAEGGVDGIPTPWSLLQGIAADDDRRPRSSPGSTSPHRPRPTASRRVLMACSSGRVGSRRPSAVTESTPCTSSPCC